MSSSMFDLQSQEPVNLGAENRIRTKKQILRKVSRRPSADRNAFDGTNFGGISDETDILRSFLCRHRLETGFYSQMMSRFSSSSAVHHSSGKEATTCNRVVQMHLPRNTFLRSAEQEDLHGKINPPASKLPAERYVASSSLFNLPRIPATLALKFLSGANRLRRRKSTQSSNGVGSCVFVPFASISLQFGSK